jgi:hypothetical protein
MLKPLSDRTLYGTAKPVPFVINFFPVEKPDCVPISFKFV